MEDAWHFYGGAQWQIVNGNYEEANRLIDINIELEGENLNNLTLKSEILFGLNDFEKSNPSYNGLKVNCSDYVEAALETMVGRQLPVDEKLSSEISATTPNQVYKTASTLENGTILKDPGKKVKKG